MGKALELNSCIQPIPTIISDQFRQYKFKCEPMQWIVWLSRCGHWQFQFNVWMWWWVWVSEHSKRATSKSIDVRPKILRDRGYCWRYPSGSHFTLACTSASFLFWSKASDCVFLRVFLNTRWGHIKSIGQLNLYLYNAPIHFNNPSTFTSHPMIYAQHSALISQRSMRYVPL